MTSVAVQQRQTRGERQQDPTRGANKAPVRRALADQADDVEANPLSPG